MSKYRSIDRLTIKEARTALHNLAVVEARYSGIVSSETKEKIELVEKFDECVAELEETYEQYRTSAFQPKRHGFKTFVGADEEWNFDM